MIDVQFVRLQSNRKISWRCKSIDAQIDENTFFLPIRFLYFLRIFCFHLNLCRLFITYFPKSSGSDVKDISFNPNTVRFFNCEKPGGKRSIGFELKSAVCRLRRHFISSGMSGISEKKKKTEENNWKLVLFMTNEFVCFWHLFNLFNEKYLNHEL